MLTCKEATAIASQGLDRKLDLRERCLLKLHLMICSGCRAAREQFEFLRKGAASYLEHLDEANP